ncbi:tRNA (adenosine(37)-N6)-threonylcarbamoyltransferase complex transferase subunit TsaD [Mycoplasmatota bacterium]|nr:tRNA (adenosine(37)-N6)-threonylcarbamoyltransferase complex transferase subunit TsaD [Mycoplasmatota bacterium]
MIEMIILAIETSCDETSAAVVKNGKEILSNIVVSQMDIHSEFGGVVPEVASRHHVTSITKVIDKAINDAGIEKSDIDLVAVTKAPGLIGALLVGINAAKAFAFSNNIPIIGIDHIKGHIYANQIENDMKFPLITLVVSGGHTELVLMKEHNRFELLGCTQDDAVGEAYDKVARVLGLSYPGGPIVDKLAKEGIDSYNLPRPYLQKDKFDFSFSGLKSAVINLIHNSKQRNEEIRVNDVCRSFQESVTDVLVTKTISAAKKYGVKQVMIAGGVAANRGLRNKLNDNIGEFELIIPHVKYCTDNAAMIGVAAHYQYLDLRMYDKMDLNGRPFSELGRD